MTEAERVFKHGFCPIISEKALAALRQACVSNDPRLTQGSTTTPPPLMCVQDWPVEAACALGFCGWAQDDFDQTVGNVEEYFAAKCFQADHFLGAPAECRWFLNWFDDTPRGEVLATLVKWIDEHMGERDDIARAEADAARCQSHAPTAVTDLF